MISALEKIGLLSILRDKLTSANKSATTAKANSEMTDQSKTYTERQYNEYQHYRGIALGFQVSIQTLEMLKTE